MKELDIITLLILFSTIFSYLNIRYLKLPSTIGLMILSLAVSTLILVLGGMFFKEFEQQAAELLIRFDFSEVLLNVMLSFMLFAGALHVNVQKLKEEKWTILILATVGILTSTTIIGVTLFYLLPYLGLQVELIYCLLFGALISPTDPIAVLAMVKKMSVSPNLEIKIAGESLFNDGFGVVVFLTLLSVAQEGIDQFEFSEVIQLFGMEVFGGLGLGLVLGYLGYRILAGIHNEHTELEILVTVSLVMVGTQIAGAFHVSAPLAMVVLGLFLGEEGKSQEDQDFAGDYVYHFWELIDEALNSILFVLIGFEILVIAFEIQYLIAGLISIFIVVLSRLISVGMPITLLSRFYEYQPNTIIILTWGGLRGGISVALALTLSEFELPNSDLLLSMTYVVVVFSILVQGLTIGRLLKSQEKTAAPAS